MIDDIFNKVYKSDLLTSDELHELTEYIRKPQEVINEIRNTILQNCEIIRFNDGTDKLGKIDSSMILNIIDESNIDKQESPYCEICGHCGEIDCCGIRNFISEHIEGKTNCKNEAYIIQDLINLCDYKDEVFAENKKLKSQLKQKENIIKKIREYVESYDLEYLHKANEHNLADILEDLLEILDKEDK